jgi:ADP-heptose:LPS heptosyltransferase
MGAVVVLRALGLGDFLTGVPALRALAREYDGHELLLAMPEVLHPLVAASGLEARVLPTRGLEPVPWEGPGPDLAVNLHGKGPESHWSLQRLQPRHLVAFGSEAAGVDGPVWRPDEHEVHRWCRLVEESLGVRADPTDLLLRPASGRRDHVVVHPGAASESRRWPADRYAAVAAHCARLGHRVVVTGGPDEVALAESVAAAAGLPADAVLAGRTDLAGLADLVARARLVVCGDTGTAHLATAFGTPSVVLFGPVSPALWGPPAQGPHTVLWHGDGSGNPHARRTDAALLAITVPEVCAAVDAHLDPRSPRPVRSPRAPSGSSCTAGHLGPDRARSPGW